MRGHRRIPIALGLVLALASTACQARRTLTVTSQPGGAEVRLDGRHMGTTPVEIEFQHYGTRRVALYLDGYVSHSAVVELRPPWYGRFPFDLLSEVLVPVGWRDGHALHATLEEGQSAISVPQLQSVIERSEELRRAGPEGPAPVARPRLATGEEGGGS